MDFINRNVKMFGIIIFFVIIAFFLILKPFLSNELNVLNLLGLLITSGLHLSFHFFMAIYNGITQNKDLALDYLITFILLLVIGFPLCSGIVFGLG
jgi:hypothetical protein